MAAGGFRPNAGVKPGTKRGPYKTKKKSKSAAKRKAKPAQEFMDVLENILDKKQQEAQEAEQILPGDYILKVLNDPTETDKARKDRLAIAALPFFHKKVSDAMGKKDEKEKRARDAGGGRFGSGQAPKLVKMVGGK
jgi:hypothetical protein